MIIAFYPGAGGNRYLRMIQHLEWKESNKSYDLTNIGQIFKHRYLLDRDKYYDQSYILTHCINATHISSKFPGHEIVFILGDLKKCLQREWALAGHERYIKKQITPDLNRLDHYNAIKDSTWPECRSLDDIEHLPWHILNEVNEDFKKNLKVNTLDNTLGDIERSILNKVKSSYEIITWHKKYYSTYPMESMSNNIINIDTDSSEFAVTMRHELELYHSEIFNEVWTKLNV